MDPFVETYEWVDFHTRFNTICSEQIAPEVRPDYFVKVEERVYVERFDGEATLSKRPDVLIAASGRRTGQAGSAVLDAPEPDVCVLDLPEDVSETYLTIHHRASRELVAIIETLSPANKRPGMDGFDEYLNKRKVIILSQVHFVELDLLRGGKRPPLLSERKPADYFAIVSPRGERPRARIHAWTVREKMPTIVIPLLGTDSVSLDLQAAFDTVYERAGYDLSIDYSAPLDPLLSPPDSQWAAGCVQAARERASLT